jgi:hypothetical protein
MEKNQAIILGVLGTLILGLSVVALVLVAGGDGGESPLAAETTATSSAAETTVTTPPATSPPATSPPVTSPPETAPPATSPPETTEPEVVVTAPNFFPPDIERVANPIVHDDFTDADCDGLSFAYSDVAPREMRLSGTPTARVRTAVIVDTWSEPAMLEEAEFSLEEAGRYLYDLTGLGFEMTEYVEAYPPDGDFIKAVIPHCYLQTIQDLPDHVILYSYGLNDNAKSFGGYAEYLDSRSPSAFWAPPGWGNRFTNTNLGDVQMYITVIHWSHEFSKCGYGDSETVISDVAINGECRNQSGSVCVAGPEYQICPDEVDNPYAFRSNYRASTIVHELMHPFGKYGNGDHSGGAECNAEMDLPEGTFDEVDANLHHQMCPYTYEALVAGFTG